MTNNTTPTETVDAILDKLTAEGILQAFTDVNEGHSYEHRHGIKEAKSALRKAFESAIEAVIGGDEPDTHEECSVSSFDSCYECDEDFKRIGRNKLREDQRQRAKEQIKLMFGE